MAENGMTGGLIGLLLRLALALAPLLVVGVCVRWYGLGWGPVHHLREPAAVLHPDLVRRLDAQAAEIHGSEDAESAALGLTAELLYFGFRHRTDLHFEHARQANDIEYAELFASAFNHVAQEAKLPAHAQIVRSQPVSLMGVAPSHSAMQSHDWVVLSDGTRRRYVDPMLHDAWLGADVSRNVQGAVDTRPATPPTPRRRERRHAGAPRPERVPEGTLHLSTVRRAEEKRESTDKQSRTRSALRFMEKLGVLP